MPAKLLKLHPNDTVAVAVEELYASQPAEASGEPLLVLDEVPKGHKVALKDIAAGEDILKYGFSIGKAREAIPKGRRVHVHNMKTGLGGTLSYSYSPQIHKEAPELWPDAKIMAYRRKDGSIAVRNELWIIPLVGCINGLADRIAELFKNSYDLSHTDGIQVWKHPFGCSQLGDDLESTQALLSSLAVHPHGGGVLLLGLGCENNTIESFLPLLGAKKDSPRIKFLAVQKSDNEIEEACTLLRGLADAMKRDTREECSFFELKIGLKCGGSDAFSGITANPLLGCFADSFTKGGGCVLMTEVPEMFGAETILMNRASDQKVFEDVVRLINNFKDYYNRNNQPIYENPSPGNKDGGISTLEDKSLGCTQKGGHVPVSGVLAYAERAPRGARNLWLLEGPGNDLVAVTNLGAAGAHIVLFTTGRGTPFGGFMPTVKVSTNTELAQRKPHWIDFDAGQILETGDFTGLSRSFGEFIQKTASGRKTNNETYGCREIAIFKKGVVL